MKNTILLLTLSGIASAATVTDSFNNDEVTVALSVSAATTAPVFTATWTGTYGSVSQDFTVTGDTSGTATDINPGGVTTGLGVGTNFGGNWMFNDTMTFTMTGGPTITANSGYTYLSDTLDFTFDAFSFVSANANGIYGDINGTIYDTTAVSSNTGADQDFGTTAALLSTGSWANNSWSVVTSTTLDLSGDILFDEVVTVPEPSSAALLGLGGLALLTRRKR